MEGFVKKFIFVSIFIFSFNGMAQEEAVSCIAHKDLQDIAKHFSQFKNYLGNKAEYCEQDMDVQWLSIANSLAVLKNMRPNEPTHDAGDAFTFKAIDEKDWWSYFTNRASRFVIQSNCPENVVAYVQPFWGNGTVNLCQLFFKLTVSSQSSTMMHEVRHFDGHSHVTCTQGNEQGVSGACDSKITGKGSYAISVQTLVGMARSQDTGKDEKPLLEAEALYMAFNKFNAVPKVKLATSLILSNAQSEVYNWSLGGNAKLIKELKEPSIVANSSNNLTVYPMNSNSDAFRMDKNLSVTVENPGLYAKHYNSEAPSEREKYQSISYFGTGGMLKDNQLITLCNTQTLNLAETDLSDKGRFVAIMSMSLDPNDQQRESLLLADNGDLYRYECRSKNSDAVDFAKSEMKLATGGAHIVDSFGFQGEQYALLDDGTLSIISFAENNTLNLEALNLPVTNKDWVSATPFSQPEVF